jgi:hypothetical protein
MSFTYRDIIDADSGDTIRHIFQAMSDGGIRSFPYVDDNPLKPLVDAWIADGNTLEPA